MTISIRRALIVAFAAIVMFITVVLFSLSLIQRDRLVRDLAPNVLGGAQLHADAEMRRLFGTIRSRLAVHRHQIEHGLIPWRDSHRLRDLLLPDVAQLRSVGSMMVGDTTGYQFLIMQYDSLVVRSPLLAGRHDLPTPPTRGRLYFTREFRASEWGDRSLWTLLDSTGRHPQKVWEQPLPGYDPRQREWLKRALARREEIAAEGGDDEPGSLVAWTDVYTLFTTKTPGISASIAARDPAGVTRIVAYDLLLDDLSAFIRAQRPTPHGSMFVLSDSGLVVGLPASTRFESEEERTRSLLRPLEEIGGAELVAWMKRWRTRPDDQSKIFRIAAEGHTYWGSYRRFDLGPGQGLWIGVSVPEDDLLSITRNDGLAILILALLAMGLGLAGAFVISGQMAKPLTALLERSQRIGALRLEPERSPPTAFREVRDLGVSIERMGVALREHLRALDRARTALTNSEERFRSTFEQVAVGMAHLSTEGRFIRVNQRFCDIIGQSREEMLQLPLADILHPDEKELGSARMRDMLSGKFASGRWEQRYLHASGATVWGLATVRLLRDASDQPLYFIAVLQDITEHRSLEAQLRQSQKLEAVGQLAGGVAHDFNNLLTVIGGNAALAKKTLPEEHPARADLDHIEYAAQRAADLTRQLLAFARREVSEPRVYAAGELVSGSRRMLRRLIGEHIELVMDVDARPAFVRVDRGQLEQVLVNLVVNARDSMPDGGTIRLSTGPVDLGPGPSADSSGDTSIPHVEIRVEDGGTGMSAEIQARIFEPFFTTKAPGEGSGLGLSTCYGIVQQAGGQVRVESRLGVGSTFRVLLPSVQAESATGWVASNPGPAPGGDETILLAEDEPAIRAIGERVLRERGYTVLVAANGMEALAIGEKLGTRVDLLVTDVIMPGLRGRDLADRLLVLRPSLKVLFISGYGQDSLQGQLPESLNFLAKPFGPEALARKIRGILDRGH